MTSRISCAKAFVFFCLGAAFIAMSADSAQAEVKLPHMFTDHAVLQRGMPVPVWGTADPGEAVEVKIAGQTKKTKADAKGNWQVSLEPLSVGEPLTLVVKGKNEVTVNDILVGEVWLCSGQSNMEWPLSLSTNADLETAAANHPQIRLVRVKEMGSQELVEDFKGEWKVCTPKSAEGFSAVGYFFGRELRDQLGVPIGLIDDSWGGSACEAWIRRDRFEGKPEYEPLMKKWAEAEKNADDKWKKEAGAGNARPANLYHGRLEPVMPYAIRGAIWYQGETNAGRAYQYRDMFPLMIQSWREDWKQGEFPFYWVQLADFMPEKPEPGDSAWAELREAQTMTQDKLPNAGQAVIIDLGEAADIHPRKKLDVGRRLARIALARDYGKKFAYQSPRYESMEKQGDKVVLKFKNIGGGLRTVDEKAVQGFAVAGADKKWHWAEARIVDAKDPMTKKDTIEVSSKDVKEPVAVRYAWADNPICNLFSEELLPVTPFRTDDWKGVTEGVLQ